jgi:hypothetical protein
MKRTRKTSKKDPNVYEPGWDLNRTQSVIDYYEARKDVDVLGDSPTQQGPIDQVWMAIPSEIVPQVQRLIARHRKSA